MLQGWLEGDIQSSMLNPGQAFYPRKRAHVLANHCMHCSTPSQATLAALVRACASTQCQHCKPRHTRTRGGLAAQQCKSPNENEISSSIIKGLIKLPSDVGSRGQQATSHFPGAALLYRRREHAREREILRHSRTCQATIQKQEGSTRDYLLLFAARAVRVMPTSA
jgi:hypothetical protein